jgi:hypothetical protein
VKAGGNLWRVAGGRNFGAAVARLLASRPHAFERYVHIPDGGGFSRAWRIHRESPVPPADDLRRNLPGRCAGVLGIGAIVAQQPILARAAGGLAARDRAPKLNSIRSTCCD